MLDVHMVQATGRADYVMSMKVCDMHDIAKSTFPREHNFRKCEQNVLWNPILNSVKNRMHCHDDEKVMQCKPL